MRFQKPAYPPSADLIQSIAQKLGCGDIIATILVNRGIDSADTADRFLNPSLAHLRPPYAIKDMEKAVRRIASAVSNREKILIFGDYDVDGVTSTVLLHEFFSGLGADVSFYIPHRRKEGYGLCTGQIDAVAIPGKTDLIITADCGSTSHSAVDKAHAAGIDIIITDHHNIAEPPPRAVAVVNPKRADCVAGFEHLSGVGVAFCLLICLRKHLREANFWHKGPEPNLKHLCDMVALGTIADQVPLIKENRVLAKAGIAQINTGSRVGINALMRACGLEKIETSEDIAFRLAPRLNAPGRLAHAEAAVRLLTSADRDTAEKTAEHLSRLNAQRQDTEKAILEHIDVLLTGTPSLMEKPAWVMFDPRWHEGVLGIVAARLAEKYFRPVVLISTMDGVGKGSARSVPGFDLFKGLTSCAPMLESFGGHSAAAGLRIAPDRIKRFAEAFAETVRKEATATVDDGGAVDCLLNLDAVTPDLLDALENLQPFGQGNPEPLFMARRVRIRSRRPVGKHHLQMQLAHHGNRVLPAIQFNVDPAFPVKDSFEQITFHLRWNRWNGNRSPRMIIREAV